LAIFCAANSVTLDYVFSAVEHINLEHETEGNCYVTVTTGLSEQE